jgi:hypothetical protein
MKWNAFVPAIGLGYSLLTDAFCMKPNSYISLNRGVFGRWSKNPICGGGLRKSLTTADAGYSFEDYDSKRVSFEPTSQNYLYKPSIWPNYYSHPSLDRDSKKLQADTDFQEALRSPNAKVLVIWKGRNMFRETANSKVYEPVKFSPKDVAAYLDDPQSIIIFLGRESGELYFAVDVSHLPELPTPPGILVDQLRSFGGVIERDEDAGLLAYARGMAVWHRSERFCSSCGSGDLHPVRAGSVRACGSCKAQFYPRIDPSIIALVTARGGQYALLGRKAAWPSGRWVLAIMAAVIIQMKTHKILC